MDLVSNRVGSKSSELGTFRLILASAHWRLCLNLSDVHVAVMNARNAVVAAMSSEVPGYQATACKGLAFSECFQRINIARHNDLSASRY